MALPNSLKNFNVYVDGVSFAGVAEELKLPKLTRKMEEYRGAGMDGPVQIDLGQEKIEIEVTCSGFVVDAFKAYGSTKVNAVMLRFSGGYQRDDSADVIAVDIVVRGRYSEIDPGNAKSSDPGKATLKLALSYYKITVDSKDLIEIDLPGFIFKVDGEDRLEAQRKAIGLA